MENGKFHLNPLVCESVNLSSYKTGGEICLEQSGQIWPDVYAKAYV